MTVAFGLAAVALVIFSNGFFVVAEYALVTAKQTRLQTLAADGNKRAKIALQLVEHPMHFIGVSQLGVTVCSIALGAIGEPLVAKLLRPVFGFGVLSISVATTLSVIVGFALVTYFEVTIGEIVPKALALARAEKLALWVAAPIAVLYKLAYPIVWLLHQSAILLTGLVGVGPAESGSVVSSEEELRLLVAAAEDTGVIEKTEEEMLLGVVDFGDRLVHEVMVPRPEIVSVSINDPLEQTMETIIASSHTRLPVTGSEPDEILGIVHTRDLLAAIHRDGNSFDLARLLRPAHLIPETKTLGELLTDFRRSRIHLALIVSEYGTVEGLVTLEDLLEEIVGEIDDEFDLAASEIEYLDDDVVRIDGTLTVEEWNELLAERYQLPLPVDGFHTVAGFVFGLLGRRAQNGDVVAEQGVSFRVVAIDGARINRLEVRPAV